MDKKWKRVWASAFAVGACALALTACSNNNNSSSSKKDQKISWMEISEIEGMDPSVVTDATSFNQLNNTMEGFYRLGKNSKIEPGVATKTTTSKDGKSWTFTLRKNAKWSNGDPVTAQDFVYSWRRTVTPKTGSQYSYLFSGIKNADDIVAGKKSPSTLGIKADGKYKVTVTLDKRIPYFKLLMGFPLFAPQNQKAVEKYGKKYGTASKYQVYNGPFVQTGWTGSNLTWKLKKNNQYWDKKAVKLNTIDYSVQKTPSTDYNLYQAGKLDAALLSAQASKQLKNQSGYTIRQTSSTKYLEMNQGKKNGLENVHLRRAISMAINRKALANAVGGANKPANTLSAEDMTLVNGKDYTKTVENAKTDKLMTYNPSEAKKELKVALKQLGKSKLTYTILCYDDDESKKAAEAIQSSVEENLKDVKININSMPKKSALNRGVQGNFEIFLMGWNADFNDPISFLDMNTTNNSYNWQKWSNKEYDKLIADSKTTSSEKTRWNDLAKAEEIILEQQGVTPLYHPATAWMIRPSLKNVVFNGAGANYDFKYAYVQ
ncbi:peptide ABC transporter substrate-binding protein [Lactobacillus kalixensis]|uniref:Oligopeptide ABC superfamily ATP binding cassette transporter, binding protein n=1 Tax=Lactobacillus kalixensis DSM 16043 TaxID=1423763 RepID=A0A0R1ULS9_9LACO|nr:peptide ABC transporter substrate-binding protein [Lactobacillus kalixensis]KRL90459.1 oligopeptide ABC superfamily ATP binding cassette transporter, binding protein [Lactobacillus kalixensis DSM 16043]